MKKILILFISLTYGLLIYGATKPNNINANDYGVLPGKHDCTPGIIKMLAAAQKLSNAEIVFPPGEYHFYPDYGVDRYYFVSNNDEGLKRIVFHLLSAKNITINGKGSSFIFHGFVNPFIVDSSANITFKNFSVDCSRPFHSEATILANNADGIDVEIPENFPFSINNGILVFTDGAPDDGIKTTVSRSATFPYTSLLEFDALKRETAFMASDYYLNGTPLPAKSLGGRKVRIFLEGLRGTVGNIITFGAATRNYPGFVLTNSTNIVFSNITIHHSGGMGIIGQRIHNVLVEKCRVTPSAGRVVSCTADATHFVNCTGKIEISNCLFENQKDDATNIHGIYVQITKKLAANEAIVQLKHSQQLGFDFLVKNAKVEFVKGKSLITKGYATVKNARRINKDFTQVVFSSEIPSGIVEGDAVAEVVEYPEIYIHNNIIQKNRARGMLLNCRGKTVVDSNYFHSPGAALLFEGDASFWFEQGGVSDCTISNNIFENCLFGVWGKAIIDVAAGIHENKETSRYNKNIRICGNTFRIFDNALLLNLYGVDGLVWKNNKVEKTTDYPAVHNEKSFFKIEYSDNIKIN